MKDNNGTAYSYVFKNQCPLCNQSTEEGHLSLYDCLKAMSFRISALEDELLASKFENEFYLSSRPPNKGD